VRRRLLEPRASPVSNAAYSEGRYYFTERAQRGIVCGRKNHYGSRSKRGTQVAALLYALMETRKLVGVDPRAYLRAVVEAALAKQELLLPHEYAAQLKRPA
jgi:transposase